MFYGDLFRNRVLGAAMAFLLLVSLFFFFREDQRVDPLAVVEHEEDHMGTIHRQQQEPNCPSYFAWIHEDLAPWSESGITREHLDEARRKGDFRLVIVDGKLYFERIQECIQTRDEITLQGLLLLLEKFPGMIPDMEMVFVCNDFPQVPKDEYRSKPPPPVFSYCTSRFGGHFDILFPDWSFWGWPQVKIRPWEQESVEIFDGANETDWFEREAIAYWKGNLWVMTPVREELLQCNNTQYNVVVYYLDWAKEEAEGFKTSSLSKQCHTRYKVYAEGRGWSASLKYLISCGSTILHIQPDFWEFFARSWLPYVEYWPISRENMCSSIKHAVDWGNAHPFEASAIGKRGQAFLKEQLTMDHVYSYMLHVMQAYAKLQRFKPEVPKGVQPWRPNPGENFGNVTAGQPCNMPPRDQVMVSRFTASQVAGYWQKCP
ncbi:protein O-glucosyltransferase 1 isoform X1 [Selaginella moellendorffii]|nr:protein O-glucosyltransferase 1 isoform X1 [Selaginella moellendorffii]|eukprot:XP_024530760.1 protein O-glucosyltransferase 1 isoform X1 [Selaginella moellendorffii]